MVHTFCCSHALKYYKPVASYRLAYISRASALLRNAALKSLEEMALLTPSLDNFGCLALYSKCSLYIMRAKRSRWARYSCDSTLLVSITNVTF